MLSEIPPMPTDVCEICGKPYQYSPSPDWDKNPIYQKFPIIARNSYWRAEPHTACAERKLRDEQENSLKGEREARRVRAMRLLREFGLPKVLTDRQFSNFEVSEENRPAFEAVESWKYSPMGLLLFGGPGRGKSHLLAALRNRFGEMGLGIAFVNVTDLLDSLREGFQDESYAQRLKLFCSKSIEILILDDFGASKPTQWAEEKLYQIIDSRLRERLPMFVSTNCSEDELNRQFHPRIASRLHEACQWVEVRGQDFRPLKGHRVENKKVQEWGPTHRSEGPKTPGYRR